MKELHFTDEDIAKLYKKIGRNVKRIREEHKISQMKLAMAIGLNSVSTISKAELCLEDKHFNIEHIYKIAKVLDVEVCEFFKEVD